MRKKILESDKHSEGKLFGGWGGVGGGGGGCWPVDQLD